MFSWTLVLVAIVTVLVYRYIKNYGKGMKLPGPMPYPVIGNYPGKLPYKTFSKWSEQYGDIFQMRMGPNPVVVLSDAKLVQEVFNDPNVSGRPQDEMFTLMQQGPYGLIFSQGPSWQEQRRFTLRHLRDYGFGKTSMESLIQEEIREFMVFLKSKEGQSIQLNRKFHLAVVNSLWTIMTGTRYQHDDPKLMGIFDEARAFNEKASKNPFMMVPGFARRFPRITGWNGVMELIMVVRNMFQTHIDEHKKHGLVDEPRDFLDAYLKEINACQDPKSSFYKEEGEKSCFAVVNDLFGAGSETTAFTLGWALLYLSKDPNVQKKLQEELDSVVGKNRVPTLADRPNLPYLEAAIMEILRISSIAPIGVFHTTMTDVTIRGYAIPKGTWVIGNQYYIHHNEKNWPNPHTFKPERFLSDDGKVLNKKPDNLIPFSVGKRVCLGETLARDEIFLFLSNIFQRFSITLDETNGPVTFDAKPGFVLSPQDFNVILKDRMA